MKTIKFMSHRKLAMSISGLLLFISIYSLATQQLNWGLDFTGGTLVEVHYSDSADLGAIRSTLTTSGYAGAVVVSFGSDRDVMIRLPQGYSDEQGVELMVYPRSRHGLNGAVRGHSSEFQWRRLQRLLAP